MLTQPLGDRRNHPRSPVARATLALVVLLAWVMAAAPTAYAHPAPKRETYKVLTYNVHGLDIASYDDESTGKLSLDARAKYIAALIATGDYDIVAINEAFFNPLNSNMKDELVSGLIFHYPFVVDVLDADGLDVDSGLMLFSRFPFVHVPVSPGESCFDDGETQAGACTVAFHPFNAVAGEDDGASKGVGFVRVANPATNAETNVFFTHLNANPAAWCTDCGPATRAKQIQEIIGFVNTWAPASDPVRDTVLMGDLNIRFVDDLGVPTGEYSTQITAGLGSIGLNDAWLQTAPTDFLSSIPDSPMKKYDYILHRPPAAPATGLPGFCIQHQTLERHFWIDDPAYSGLPSDHYPYAAVIGRVAPRCRPNGANQPPEGITPGVITHPGSYQWYHFDAGTWDFGVNAPVALELTAYPDNDLSTPLNPSFGGGVIPASNHFTERIELSPRVPFFLRVRVKDPSSLWTGSYLLDVDRHDGTTWDEAIQLDAFDPRLSKELSGAPLGAVFFKLRTRTPTQPAQQRVEFRTGKHRARLRMRVFDWSKNQLLATQFHAVENQLVVDPSGFSPIPATGAWYYLVVERHFQDLPTPFEVEWRTNLFLVALEKIHIHDMEDDWELTSYDEPEAVFSLEGGAVTGDFPFPSMDEGDHHSFPEALRTPPLKILGSVGLTMYENNGSPGDCQTDPGNQCNNLGYHQIDHSGLTDDRVEQSHIYQGVDDGELDGNYELTYEAWRRIDEGGTD